MTLGRGTSSAGAPAEATRRLLVSLACYFFLAGLLQSLVALYGTHLSMGGAELGITLALASAGLGFVSDLPFAAVADLRTPWLPAGWGLLLSAIASLILLRQAVVGLVVGAFFFGIASSAISNALLSWLSLGGTRSDQARVQGFNAAVQRLGAVGAAGVVGLALGWHRLVMLPIAGVAVSLSAYLLLRSLKRPPPSATAGQGPLTAWLLKSYVREIRLLSRGRLVVASATNLAINLLLLGTNAYVPVIGGPHRALVVALALVGRDAAAISAGLFIALTRPDLARSVAAGGITLAAAAVTGLTGVLLKSELWLPVLCTVEGALIGSLIAAANLLAIDGTASEERTVGMAASILPGRLALLVVPLAASIVFRQYGLRDVFYLLAVCLLAASSTVLASTARPAGRRAVSRS